MDDQTYLKYLERAHSMLPEKVLKHERFQPPDVESMIEGTRTIITNWRTFTRRINFNKPHLIRYLARELATSAIEEGNRLILMGRFRTQQIDRVLKTYIKRYIICEECGRPDTHLVREDRILFKVCEACGARKSVE